MGAVTIITNCFSLNAGATILGLAEAYPPGMSPCQFSIGNWINGGGGHGGAGGAAGDPNCDVCPGEAAFDDPIHPTSTGGNGGNADCLGGSQLYSVGGGLLDIIVYNSVSGTLGAATINGTINMNGNDGCWGCGCSSESGGGGAGGAIIIEANEIDGGGTMTANGGNGGTSSGSGGGGGGIISLIRNISTFSGTFSVGGGNGSVSYCTHPIVFNGSPGIVSFTSAPVTGY